MDFIEPMLAGTLSKEKLENLWDDDNIVAEKKFDGGRYLFVIDYNGKMKALSRRISKKTNQQVDKAEKLPQWSKIKYSKEFYGLILDGELIFSDKEKSPEVFKNENVGKQNYVAFDILQTPDIPISKMQNLPFKTRRVYLEKWIKRLVIWMDSIGNSESAHMIYVTKQVFKNKKQFSKEMIDKGWEGIILKKLDSKYIGGDRKNWIKVKMINTYDCIITGFYDANEWYAEPGATGADGIFYKDGRKTRLWENGWIGGILFAQYDKKNGQLIEVGRCAGITDEMREEFSKNKNKYIGKVIEVKAQERSSSDGSVALIQPRFNGLRKDKNPEDCIIGDC